MKQITVTDVTLCKMSAERGDTFSFREKMNAAKTLERIGIDRLCLPGLVSGRADEIVLRTVAESVDCTAAMYAGTTEESVAAAWNCIKNAKKPCLYLTLPVSTVQMEYQFHLKAAAMLEKIAVLCRAAKALCEDVEFCAADATRAENGFLAKCLQTAAENGANAVTVCDNNGAFLPEDWAALIGELRPLCTAALYAAPSDAFGMASACAAAAIRAGADGIRCAVGGDEAFCAVPLLQFASFYRAKGEALGISCGIDLTAVNRLTEQLGSPAAAGNAAQESSHTRETDIFDASATEDDIASAVRELGYELSETDHGKVWEEFRRVVEKKESLGTRELEAIIASTAMQVPSTYHLISYVVNSGNIITATATVALEKDGVRFDGVSIGDGPIDAVFHAIEQIIGHHYELDDFRIQAVTKGREAVGSSLIRLRADGRLYAGNGVSTDIIGACVRAYINALNKIVYEENNR